MGRGGEEREEGEGRDRGRRDRRGKRGSKRGNRRIERRREVKEYMHIITQCYNLGKRILL